MIFILLLEKTLTLIPKGGIIRVRVLGTDYCSSWARDCQGSAPGCWILGGGAGNKEHKSAAWILGHGDCMVGATVCSWSGYAWIGQYLAGSCFAPGVERTYVAAVTRPVRGRRHSKII